MTRFQSVFLIGLLINGSALMASAQQNKQPLPQADASYSNGVRIFGKPVDAQTRCVHWHSALDIIAIKFKCCDQYYPCYSCHEETTDHEAVVWPKTEFGEKAILCGVCGHELTISEYMTCNNTCPKCAAQFNPGCSNHYHLYFETGKK